MELLCLDIESEFGAFNKPFSNTGGLLTYLFPPKTAIIGMLGATIGYTFENTLKTFSNIKVCVEPLKSIETKIITYLCHYGYGGHPEIEKKGIPVNIRQEILINPKYRLYLDLESIHENEMLLSDINILLKKCKILNIAKDVNGGFKVLFQNKISYYSLYMGKNEFPLNYQLMNVKLKSLDKSDFNKYVPTNCVMPRDSVLNYKIASPFEMGWLKLTHYEPFSFFILSDVPTTQNTNREFSNFKDFLLKDHTRKTTMDVEPKLDDNYSFYKTEEGNLIVCF
ncbi:MAG: hypothetical protein CVT89_00740 [Candidatus Altiarchaeales archaeon HGW-Altiarchaeales-2]|nr:MAG: hypothetical protein CVT89_00740 [Candidatus Altiarchaeales archaeon HGW-Altiarchaeales-2]